MPINPVFPTMGQDPWGTTLNTALEVIRDGVNANESELQSVVTPSDTFIASQIEDPTSLTSVAIRTNVETLIVQLPPSNGTDDSAALNAVLSAARPNPETAVKYVGKSGEHYFIYEELALRSRSILDMTGCYLEKYSTGAGGNFVRNYAVDPIRSVLDASVTEGSTTLTSVTAAFTAADVGLTVCVKADDGNGVRPLVYTTIESVTSATEVVLVAPSAVTLAAAQMSLYGRDHDITVTGGVWNRRMVSGTLKNDKHSLHFRRVDGLSVGGNGMRILADTGGKFSISVGDVSGYYVGDVFYDVESDGCHVTGPAYSGTVENLYGYTGDDMVSITPRDWALFGGDDCYGDVTGLVISNIFAERSLTAVKVVVGQDCRTSGVTIQNIKGSVRGDNCAVWVGDGGNDQPSVQGGLMDDVTVRGVSVATKIGVPMVQLRARNAGVIRAHDIQSALDQPEQVVLIDVNVPTSPTGGIKWDRLELFNITENAANLNNRPVVSISSSTHINQVQAFGVAVLSGTSAGASMFSLGGTIDSLSIISPKIMHQNGMALMTGGTNGVVTITDPYIDKGALVSAPYPAAPITDLIVTGGIVRSGFRAFDLGSAVRLKILGTDFTTNQGWLLARATAVLDVYGTARLSNSNMQKDAGAVVRYHDLALPVDVAFLDLEVGGMAYNFNVARSCGVGPVVCDGTVWKNVATGAVYPSA